MSNKQVVFIMGTGHCGSTLLDLLLGSHSRVFSLGELNHLADALDDENLLCTICSGECEYWDRRFPRTLLQPYFPKRTLLTPVVKRLSQNEQSLYQQLMSHFGYDILVDSSKNLKWIEAQLRPAHHWIEVSPVLLYMARDGRAVVNSYLRKYPENSMAREAGRWKQQTEAMEAYYEQFSGDKLMVFYEELCIQPAEVMQEVCQLLSIDFEPTMLNYWIHDHHLVGGNAGTRSLIHKYRQQFSQHEQGKPDSYAGSWHGDYYRRAELAIKLDTRWQEELTPEQLEVFETIAGATNQLYAYDTERLTTPMRFL